MATPLTITSPSVMKRDQWKSLSTMSKAFTVFPGTSMGAPPILFGCRYARLTKCTANIAAKSRTSAAAYSSGSRPDVCDCVSVSRPPDRRIPNRFNLRFRSPVFMSSD